MKALTAQEAQLVEASLIERSEKNDDHIESMLLAAFEEVGLLWGLRKFRRASTWIANYFIDDQVKSCVVVLLSFLKLRKKFTLKPLYFA